SQQNELSTESQQEKSSVQLLSLLSSLIKTVSEARDLGSKFDIVQKKRSEKKSGARMMQGYRGGYGGVSVADGLQDHRSGDLGPDANKTGFKSGTGGAGDYMLR
ncbi:hypothetical protein LTR28_008482, partial [Elasticomyces elasticus]